MVPFVTEDICNVLLFLQIFSEHSLEVNVRWLGVLYFKNGVDRYWRKTAPKAINEEEKVITCVSNIGQTSRLDDLS